MPEAQDALRLELVCPGVNVSGGGGCMLMLAVTCHASAIVNVVEVEVI